MSNHHAQAASDTVDQVVIVSPVTMPSELNLANDPSDSDDEFVRALDAALEEGSPIIG